MTVEGFEHSPESELPEGFKLLPGEELIVSTPTPPRRSLAKLSSLHEMTRLTGAPNSSEIGAYGPAVAAITLESDDPAPSHQELFNVVFGRDSERVALDLIEHYPQLALTTINKLAAYQGTQYNMNREEGFGKIPHEIRDKDDIEAQKLTAELGWDWPYYGSVDSTPQFVRLIAAYCAHYDPQGEILNSTFQHINGETHVLGTAFTRAVDWLKTSLGESSLGLLEYKRTFPGGTLNQAWKDSEDSYHHANGEMANHDYGIASVEVQAIACDALIDAADIYGRLLNRPDEAQDLREMAEEIKQVVKTAFWTEDKGGYFVLGLDRDQDGAYRQMKIRTSNMGHLLNSRILDGNDDETVRMRKAILNQLRSPEMLALCGIRTLASDEVRYREWAYHNGSVWFWDTHYIALGARRHAEDPEFLAFADHLDEKILTAVDVFGSFPEYATGGDKYALNSHIVDVFDTITQRINRVVQPPQEVQAWTVAAILATKRRHGDRIHSMISR